MRVRIVLVCLLAGVLALILWAPWITKAYAEASTADAFVEAWLAVADGCGFNCGGCGILDSHRTVAGIFVTYEYACGLLPYDSPEFHRTGTAYVSLLGTVTGLPKP